MWTNETGWSFLFKDLQMRFFTLVFLKKIFYIYTHTLGIDMLYVHTRPWRKICVSDEEGCVLHWDARHETRLKVYMKRKEVSMSGGRHARQ